MILDDGGDATLLVHKGVEYEKTGVVPTVEDDDLSVSDEYRVILDTLRRALAEDPQRWTTRRERHPRRHRGDHHRRAPALPARRAGPAAVPGDQRQRLGHQEQVRQRLRHPALADRRPQPGHRRADRRQGRGRLRLRRRRQGQRGRARRPGRAGDRHRGRPDLRAAGAAAGLPGGAAGRRRGPGRHRRHHHRQQGHRHRRAHGPDEAPGDPGQRRPLRQRDRHGRAGPLPGHPPAQHQAAGRRVGLPGRALDHRAVRGPADEPGQRHRAPVVRDEQQLLATR